MQTQRRVPKHTEEPAEQERILAEIPDVTDSLTALDSAIKDNKKAEKQRKKQEQKKREEMRRCCGLVV